MKSLAFTSSMFSNKTTNDRNTCKSPGNYDGEEEKVFVKRSIPNDHEQDVIVDFSREVGLTKSDRLLFEPGRSTKSIMEEALLNKRKDDTGAKIGSFKGGVAMAMESRDLYRDFRDSMEEMVAAHGGGGVRADWEWLQEMLAWYLGANGRTTHGAILGAFVDLLMSLTKSESCHYNLYSNHVSSCSSNCSCFSFEIEEKSEKPHI